MCPLGRILARLQPANKTFRTKQSSLQRELCSIATYAAQGVMLHRTYNIVMLHGVMLLCCMGVSYIMDTGVPAGSKHRC